MTEARCPLVLEIEEAAERRRNDRHANHSVEVMEAHVMQSNCHWDRMRAALEAAEEVIGAADACTAYYLGEGPNVNAFMLGRAIARYRAATRRTT